MGISLLLLVTGGKLTAEENVVTGKFVVSFSAEDNQKAWVVNALEQNVYNDLSGYARVIPFKKVPDENEVCTERDVDCILEIYKKLNVDALMLGKVDESDIDYEVYDVQNMYLVNTGFIVDDMPDVLEWELPKQAVDRKNQRIEICLDETAIEEPEGT